MRLKTYKIATPILLKFLTLKWNISETIWRIEVNDGSIFCIFHSLSFQLNFFFDRRFPLSQPTEPMHWTLNCAIQSFPLLCWSWVPGSLHYIISLTLEATWVNQFLKKGDSFPKFKELHLQHISTLYHASISSASIKLVPPPPSSEAFRYCIRGINVFLKMWNFNFHWKYFWNLTDERLPRLFCKKSLNLRVSKYHTEPMY